MNARRELVIPRWLWLGFWVAVAVAIVVLLVVIALQNANRDADQDANRIYRSAVNCVVVNDERADYIAFVAQAAVDLSNVEGLRATVMATGDEELPPRLCDRLPGVTPEVLAQARVEADALRDTRAEVMP